MPELKQNEVTETTAENEFPALTPSDTVPYFDDDFIVQVRERLIEHYLLNNNNNTVDSVSDVQTNNMILQRSRSNNDAQDHQETEDDQEEKDTQSKLPYHVSDVKLIKSDDNWFLRRFLAWKPATVNEAAEHIHKALTWRKKVQLHSW